MVFHDLSKRRIHCLTKVHHTVRVFTLGGRVGAHGAGNVQNENHIHRCPDLVFEGDLVFLTQRRQCHAEGIGIVMVKCAVVIGTVNNRLIRYHLTVNGLTGFVAGLTELSLDVGGGRVGEVPSFDLHSVLVQFSGTIAFAGNRKEFAIIRFIRSQGNCLIDHNILVCVTCIVAEHPGIGIVTQIASAVADIGFDGGNTGIRSNRDRPRCTIV